MSKETFIRNYTGSLNPEAAYELAQSKKKNKETFQNATANKAANTAMEKEANRQAYNKIMRR